MKKSEYKKISVGVYQTTSGTGVRSKKTIYRVRKTISGKLYSEYFTNKAKAINAYKILTKYKTVL